MNENKWKAIISGTNEKILVKYREEKDAPGDRKLDDSLITHIYACIGFVRNLLWSCLCRTFNQFFLWKDKAQMR